MKLRNLVLTGLMALMIFVPTAVFADEIETEGDEWQEIRLEQVSEYTPDQLSEWTRLFDSKDVLKAERAILKAELDELVENVWKPMRETEKAEVKEGIQEYITTTKLQVLADVITKREAVVLIETYRIDAKADFLLIKEENEADKIAREADKVYHDALREEKKSLNEAIKLAIDEDNLTEIPDYLNAVLLINQTLELQAIDTNNEILEQIEILNSL
jgi:hypothetical protein